MAAGHIVAGQCVDVAASTDLYFSLIPGNITSAGSLTIEAFYTKLADGWYVKTNQYSSTGIPTERFTVPASPPSLASCDTSQNFNDMTIYLTAVIGLWVVVTAARKVIDMFRVPHAE